MLNAYILQPRMSKQTFLIIACNILCTTVYHGTQRDQSLSCYPVYSDRAMALTTIPLLTKFR